MDLGPGRRATWQESGGVELGRVGPAPPGAATICRPTRSVPSSRSDYMTMQIGCPRQSYVDTSSVAPVNYADMRTGIAAEKVSLPRTTGAAPSSSSTASASPAAPQGAAAEQAAPSSLLGGPQGPGGMSAFTRVNLSPNHNQSAKVIRADTQGCRRRHSSETFSAPTHAGNTVSLGAGAAVGGSGGGGGGGSSSSSEDVKRHSSASFENVWLRPGDLAGASKETAPVSGAAGGLEKSLNYIDLDLAKDVRQRPPRECPSQQQPLPPPPPHQPSGSREGSSPRRSSEDLSTYASISFQKPPEDRQ